MRGFARSEGLPVRSKSSKRDELRKLDGLQRPAIDEMLDRNVWPTSSTFEPGGQGANRADGRTNKARTIRRKEKKGCQPSAAEADR